MTLSAGTRFGPYEIESALGSGGMGEVYRARDTRLDRAVAIKILPPGLASDSRRRERFEREARAISSLNHPHICTLFDVGHQDGVDYLVMELLDGQTLSDRIARGPLPLGQALACAVQVADALDLAHRQGIVHRDLKPANIMMTRSGAKLLDFGIALAARPEAGPATAQATLTEAGMLVGTPQYMAPEQLEGRAADARSDLFAFGAVLYEMLTGRKAFAGESTSKLIAAVLDSEPAPIAATQPLTPPALEHLVMTCLVKNPDERWQSAGDAKRLLDWIASGVGTAATPAPGVRSAADARRKQSAAIVAPIVALAALGALTWAFWGRQRPQPPPPETRLEITTPPTTQPWSIAMSPDGRTVAFVADAAGQSTLWVRPLDAEARQIRDTTGASLPFWSPDNQSIGFFADGKLKRVEMMGGAPQVLADAAQPHGGVWARDGSIVFSPHQVSPLLRVSSRGGEPVPVTRLASGHVGHLFPQLLPDGRHVLYFVAGAPEIRGAYVGLLDQTPPRRLLDVTAPAAYVATGHVLFARENGLFAQALDRVRFELTGQAVRVADRVTVRSGVGGSDFAGISASDNGDIIYRSAGEDGGRQLTWLDRSGRTVTRVGSPDRARFGAPLSMSPDGHRLALTRRVDGNTDLWLVELERGGAMRRLTFGAAADSFGLWSRDGRRLTYGTNPSGPLDIYQRLLDSGGDEPLLVTSRNKAPVDWSPDGRFLAYLDADPNTHLDIWAFPVDAQEKPFPLVQSPNEDVAPQFSPDGKWLAYQSDESRRHQVYIRPFRASGVPLLISTAGGVQPRWRRDGGELFYVGLDRQLMSVKVAFSSDGQSIRADIPMPLFETRLDGGISQREYEVSPDGQRFLMDVPVDGPLAPIIVIQHRRPQTP